MVFGKLRAVTVYFCAQTDAYAEFATFAPYGVVMDAYRGCGPDGQGRDQAGAHLNGYARAFEREQT